MQFENVTRNLCQIHFPRRRIRRTPCPQIRSITAQTRFAWRQLMRMHSASIQVVFTSWNHTLTFEKLHKTIRKRTSKIGRMDLIHSLLRMRRSSFNIVFKIGKNASAHCAPSRPSGTSRCSMNMVHRCPNPKSLTDWFNIFRFSSLMSIHQSNLLQPYNSSPSLRIMSSMNFNTCQWPKPWHRTDSQPLFGDILQACSRRLSSDAFSPLGMIV